MLRSEATILQRTAELSKVSFIALVTCQESSLSFIVVEVFDDARSKESVLTVLEAVGKHMLTVSGSSRLLGHLRALSHKKSNKAGSPEDARILVFVLYKKEASRVEGMLRSKGYTVGGLHGDMSQSARMEALQNFKSGTTGLLVATDVAARGLDIPNVAAVINYSFPLTIEDYIHRIGRTGTSMLHLLFT